MNGYKGIIALLVILFLGAGNVFTQTMDDTSRIEWKEGFTDIHHINTGRGNCTFIIMPDGTTLMVDAGDIVDDSSAIKRLPLLVTPPYPDGSKTAGQWIAAYISQVLPQPQKPVIDYALITHFHGDHYGVITDNSKLSASGAYRISGITEVGELIPIKMLIDRNYPLYNYPVNLREAYKAEPGNFMNLMRFIEYQQKANGMQAASLEAGATKQITLKHQKNKYPGFFIRGVKTNGTIWTGNNNETFTYFTADSIKDDQNKFSENPLSLAIKLSYGKFDYYTGGDNTGLQGYGLPTWFDVETPIARAVGKVDVSTLNHHGNRDGTNEYFLKTLQPNVVVEQTWCSDHPGQEVMHRLISNHLYKGEKNIFATNIQEVTKHTLGGWFTKGYKSMFGHVIIRVLPGGESYYVLIAETISEKVQIRKKYGPYQSR